MRGIYAGIGSVLCALCATSEAAVSEPTILSDASLDAITAGQDLPEPLASSYDVLATRAMDPGESGLATIPGSSSGVGGPGSLSGPGGAFGLGGLFGPSIGLPIGVGFFGDPDDLSESSGSSSSSTP